MPAPASIESLLARVGEGEEAAIAALWEQYFPQLARVAEAKLARGGPRMGRAEDGEDAALSAIDSFCRAMKRGRFPNLADEDGLWRLLFRMTTRKAVDRIRLTQAQARGGGRLAGESALGGGAESTVDLLAQQPGDSPDPLLTAAMNEEFERLFNVLPDDELRQIALARLEGYTSAETAERLDLAPRTVERRLQLIRRIWRRELELNDQPEMKTES